MKYSIFAFILLLTSCGDAWVDPDKHVWVDFNDTSTLENNETTNYNHSAALRVAVASMTTPTETFFRYNDMFSYLEEKLGRQIQLVQRRTYKEVNDLLKENRIDMAFICSGAYVAGVNDSAFNLFLLPERDNMRHYHAYVIVRKDAAITSFADLKGKRFAFSDSLSNTGMYYPLKRVHDFNSVPESFFSTTYISNAHDNSIELVERGIIDGASVNSLIFDYTKRFYPEKVMNIKIIEESKPFGIPPVVVSKQIKASLRNELFDVMTNMVKDKQGRDVLRNLMINRFVSDSDTIYNGIREMCEGVCDFKLNTDAPKKILSAK